VLQGAEAFVTVEYRKLVKSLLAQIETGEITLEEVLRELAQKKAY